MKNLGSKIGWPLAVLLIAWLADKFFNNEYLLNKIWELIVIGASGVWWMLTIQMPLWVVLIIILILFGVLVMIGNRRNSNKPAFINYVADIFWDHQFTWEWKLDATNKWEAVGITPYCKEDNTLLIYGKTGGIFPVNTFKCPRCNREYLALYNDFYRVKAVIHDNANKMSQQLAD